MTAAPARRLLVIVLLPALLLTAAGAQSFRATTPAFVFRSAAFVLDPGERPPGPEAAWQQVTLPDDWYVSRPGYAGTGWYHITFDLPAARYFIHTLYLAHGSARNERFILNGRLVTNTFIQGDAQALNWDEPMRFATAPALLRPGRNALYVRVTAVADLRQGLSRVRFGPSLLVMPAYFRRWAIQVDALRLFGGGGLAAGLLALAFWARIPGDKVMFWFGITALAWAMMALPPPGPRLGTPAAWDEAASFPLRFAYVPPLLVLCLRLGGRRLPAAEVLLWLFSLGGAVLMPLGGDEVRARIITVWSTVYLVALTALLAWLIMAHARHRTASFWLLIAAGSVAVVLNLHDYGRWMGWFDYDDPTLAHFHVPFVLAAIGVTLIDRQVRAIRAVAQANAALEARIAEKTQEIESNYRQLRVAEHERALADERRRIMADMHDGVGASLMGVRAMIRRQAAWPQIERRVDEAMLELRLAIDSLAPVDGDLGVVLGNVRHRMRETIEDSGVRLSWQVGELPTLDYLTPKAVLAIERIVLEAISNALRHSRAATIAVRTAVDAAGGQLHILVEDDGRGFDPATVRRGRGLDSISSRARGIGATVGFTSADSGTCVTLTLKLAASPAEAGCVARTPSLSRQTSVADGTAAIVHDATRRP